MIINADQMLCPRLAVITNRTFSLDEWNPLCSNNLINSENFTKDLGAVFGGSLHRSKSLNESTHHVLRSKTCQLPWDSKKENVPGVFYRLLRLVNRATSVSSSFPSGPRLGGSPLLRQGRRWLAGDCAVKTRPHRLVRSLPVARGSLRALARLREKSIRHCFILQIGLVGA